MPDNANIVTSVAANGLLKKEDSLEKEENVTWVFITQTLFVAKEQLSVLFLQTIQKLLHLWLISRSPHGLQV